MHTSNINHLGIIMDGNRRWAKEHNLPSIYGHKRGKLTADMVVKFCIKNNIKILTLFTFSNENWNRPQSEIKYIFQLTKMAIKKESAKLHKNNVKIQFLGLLHELPDDLRKIMTKAMELTKNNNGLILNFAFNYGGQAEIIDAVNRIIKDKIDKVTPKTFEKYLFDPNMPPPDLIIRTSGEQRTSGFLLWHSAYSELYFSQTKWPAFTEKDLIDALSDYEKRGRNFGK